MGIISKFFKRLNAKINCNSKESVKLYMTILEEIEKCVTFVDLDKINPSIAVLKEMGEPNLTNMAIAAWVNQHKKVWYLDK